MEQSLHITEPRARLLENLRRFQVKPKLVVCTKDVTCWCNNVQYRFPSDQQWDECLSPVELFKQQYEHFSPRDRDYVFSLLNRPFIG